VKLAEAYGAVGIRVEKTSEVKAALEKAMGSGKPVIIDFIVECEENVSPMVPAGAPINEILDLERKE
jgi:acetolactate synthase-1/2/3 large subunit